MNKLIGFLYKSLDQDKLIRDADNEILGILISNNLIKSDFSLIKK